MVAPVIGTSACIWCGEPVFLRKNCNYTLYCSPSRKCKSLNNRIKHLLSGRTAQIRKENYYNRYVKVADRVK